MKVKSLSLVRLLATPWTAAYQAPPSMGFSRQEFWSGVPLPSPFNCTHDDNNVEENFVLCVLYTIRLGKGSIIVSAVHGEQIVMQVSLHHYEQLVKTHHYADSISTCKSVEIIFAEPQFKVETNFISVNKCKALPFQSLSLTRLKLLLPIRHKVYFISLY